ncbi:MAG: hypothetical protein K2H43_01790, partial [Clostridia bacterium]|nr:hypothetical protein [Clostridia bacterium]
MKDLLKQAAESGSGDAEDPFANLELTDEDYEQVVGSEGFELSLALKLETAEMFASLSAGKEQESVESLIQVNVDHVVGDIMPKVNTLIKNAMPVVSKAVINQAISDQVEKALEGSGTSAQEVMEKAGFTEQYITDKTADLVDAIYADDATVDTVADSVIDTVEDVFNKLQESEIEEFQNAELTEEAKAEIREQVKESLAMLADEDGNINADEFVADFILQGINQALGKPSDTSIVPKAAALLADSSAEEPSSEEQLKARLTELIMEKVDGGTVNTLVLVMRIIAGLILFTMFT